MTPIDIQVNFSKGKVKGQTYSSYVGEGEGISALQISIFLSWDLRCKDHKGSVYEADNYEGCPVSGSG